MEINFLMLKNAKKKIIYMYFIGYSYRLIRMVQINLSFLESIIYNLTQINFEIKPVNQIDLTPFESLMSSNLILNLYIKKSWVNFVT